MVVSLMTTSVSVWILVCETLHQAECLCLEHRRHISASAMVHRLVVARHLGLKHSHYFFGLGLGFLCLLTLLVCCLPLNLVVVLKVATLLRFVALDRREVLKRACHALDNAEVTSSLVVKLLWSLEVVL